jgi:hypothetical protein
MATNDINITIKNLPQIKAAFAKSPLLMIKELNFAIQHSVKTIEQRSRDTTPVDTGFLRASHYAIFSNLRGEVGTNMQYDIFVHEGTKFMRARPYLRNAIKSSQGTVDHNFKRAVEIVLDKIGSDT